jgi:CDP-diacylglycerol--serine O-phosphatidyltransferase
MLAFNGKTLTASWFIGLAAVFDFLDGLAARVLKSYSDIGKQLDSLADLVSFGMAPAAILFRLLIKSVGYENFSEIPASINSVIPFFASLIVVFSALRLAKFNIDTRQSDHFIGLPTPANAVFFASLPLINEYNCNEYTCIINNTWFLSGIIIFHCYLMVSGIKLFSLKFKSLNFRENNMRFIFIGISLILLIILQYKSIPVIVYVYLLLSSLIKQETKEKKI